MALSEWEPIVEYWPCDVIYKRSPFNQNNYLDEILFTDDSDSAHAPLNINISKPMIEAITTTAKLWKEGLINDKPISVKFYPYIFRNNIGFDVTVVDPMGTSIVIATGKEEGYNGKKKSKRKEKIWTKELLVSFTCSELDFNISIDIRKVQQYRICCPNTKRVSIISVTHIDGKKIIELQSPITFKNSTDIPLDVGVYLNDQIQLIGRVGTHEFISIV